MPSMLLDPSRDPKPHPTVFLLLGKLATAQPDFQEFLAGGMGQFLEGKPAPWPRRRSESLDLGRDGRLVLGKSKKAMPWHRR